MGPDQVAAHARERLGVEVQSARLARAGRGGAPAVWAVMTENGRFWVVAGAGRVELFHDVTPGAAYARCSTAVEAARRFLELHPSACAEGAGAGGGPTYACRACGADVTPAADRPGRGRRCAGAAAAPSGRGFATDATPSTGSAARRAGPTPASRTRHPVHTRVHTGA